MILRKPIWLALMMAAIFASQVPAQIPCRYEVSAIIQAPPCPFIGPPPTIGTGISPNGRYVCGFWYQCDTGYKAFFFDVATQQFTTLPFPAGVVSMTAAAVNDNGMVVGQLEHDPSNQYQGFVWNSQTGQYTILLPLPGGAWAGANAINSSNTVCGFRSIGSPGDPVNPRTAFQWSATDGFTDLGLVNGTSTVAVQINDIGDVCFSIGFTSAGLWSVGRITILQPPPNAKFISARSINGSGQLLLQSIIQETPVFLTLAVILDRCGWHNLAPLPGYPNSAGAAFADNGLVIGHSTAPGVAHPCLWWNQEVVDMRSLVANQTGLNLNTVSDIDQSGKVVGNGTTGKGEPVSVVLSPIAIVGDINGNCLVDIDDLLSVITEWGETKSAADLNQDGVVNIDDLLIVIIHWTLS